MLALSVKGPWAQFIIYGVPQTEVVDLAGGSSTVRLTGRYCLKDVENRSWPIPKQLVLPQRIYIHVGLRDDNDVEGILDLAVKRIGLPFMTVMCMMSPRLGRGALLGTVELVSQVTESESPWFVGKYGFVMRDPQPLVKPIPCKGRQGFFEPQILSAVH